jgi:hypothetical protein
VFGQFDDIALNSLNLQTGAQHKVNLKFLIHVAEVRRRNGQDDAFLELLLEKNSQVWLFLHQLCVFSIHHCLSRTDLICQFDSLEDVTALLHQITLVKLGIRVLVGRSHQDLVVEHNATD